MELIRQILAIGFVFILLASAIWWMRQKGLVLLAGRGGPKKVARRLELAERLALTPQHSLHLVRIADRTLLVGAHPQGFRLLASFRSGTGGEAE